MKRPPAVFRPPRYIEKPYTRLLKQTYQELLGEEADLKVVKKCDSLSFGLFLKRFKRLILISPKPTHQKKLKMLSWEFFPEIP